MANLISSLAFGVTNTLRNLQETNSKSRRVSKVGFVDKNSTSPSQTELLIDLETHAGGAYVQALLLITGVNKNELISDQMFATFLPAPQSMPMNSSICAHTSKYKSSPCNESFDTS